MRTILGQLKEEDEFSLVWFSSDAEAWSEELLPADEDNVEEALEFIDKGEAMGGTNIHSALLKGIEVRVTLSDGLPVFHPQIMLRQNCGSSDEDFPDIGPFPDSGQERRR